MFLRRLLKWFVILVLVLAAGVLILIWPVLGVNPLEGDVDQLWDVTSIDVDFFARFPAARLLDEPIVEALAARRGFEGLEEARAQLAELTAEVARQANPQIPLGLFEIDLREDFLGREMAVAGTIKSDFARMSWDNFLFMTRVGGGSLGYPRFVSALKRDFIRDRLPIDWEIEVKKGLYFKVIVDARTAQGLKFFRAVKGRPGADNTFYLARIKDVLLFSDSDLWIEHALQGGVNTLPADAWFDSEFKETSEGDNAFELFVRQGLMQNVMMQHGRGNTESAIGFLRALLPTPILGDLTLRLRGHGRDRLALTFSNKPPQDGFGSSAVKNFVRQLYDSEKGDTQADFSENGIGRFVPRDGTAAALVLHARPEELVELAISIVPRDDLRLLDDEVRKTSRSRYSSFQRLFNHLTEDLGETHLIVVHRPKVFETADLSLYRDPPGSDWLPEGQFSYTLVSRVKDNVAPDKIREKIFQNLKHLNFKGKGAHPSGRFHLAEFITEPPDAELIQPAYGPMVGGMNYLVLSTHVEAAEAVYRAAEDPDERIINEATVDALVDSLPPRCTLALLVAAPAMRAGILDHVREYARIRMDVPAEKRRFREDFQKEGQPEPSDADIQAAADRYIAETYPRLKEEFEAKMTWMEAVDTMAFAISLGVGSDKKVQGSGVVLFTPVPEGE